MFSLFCNARATVSSAAVREEYGLLDADRYEPVFALAEDDVGERAPYLVVLIVPECYVQCFRLEDVERISICDRDVGDAF